ncbi:hypothetical protein [Kitasatospora sp. NBC_00315]|uniref:hypothetical protein n=1 Tax=Kitasatospora sp. NBC_00315 TaxID=2975963 RepID=UPI00324747A7
MPAAPDAATGPAGEDRWGEDGRKLLAVAEAMHRRLTRFLEETSTGDPVAAFDALAKVVSAYGTRAYMTAQEIRDKARWPDLSEHERIVARSRERIDRWAADDPDGPDTEQDAPDADPGNDTPDPSCASRGETAAIGEHQEQPLPQQPAGPEAAQKAAFTDPQIRFDFPPFLGDLELTFGPGWELGSWDTEPEAEGVLELWFAGKPIGWTAPLPDGPWGPGGSIAALHRSDGTATVITDGYARPQCYPSPELALDALQRAYTARTAEAPPRH